MTDEMKNDGFYFLSVLKLSGHVFIDSIRSFYFPKNMIIYLQRVFTKKKLLYNKYINGNCYKNI